MKIMLIGTRNGIRAEEEVETPAVPLTGQVVYWTTATGFAWRVQEVKYSYAKGKLSQITVTVK